MMRTLFSLNKRRFLRIFCPKNAYLLYLFPISHIYNIYIYYISADFQLNQRANNPGKPPSQNRDFPSKRLYLPRLWLISQPRDSQANLIHLWYWALYRNNPQEIQQSTSTALLPP